MNNENKERTLIKILKFLDGETKKLVGVALSCD